MPLPYPTCVVEERDAQSPMSGKKRIHTLPRLERGPDDSGGIWDEGRMPDSRDTAASASLDF